MVLAVFIDASFAGNPNMSSQLGFFTVLIDCDNNANIIHWGSVKSKRITRSVLAAELYAMVHCFDQSTVLHTTLQDIFWSTHPIADLYRLKMIVR